MAEDLILRVQYGEATSATEPKPQQLNTQLSGATRNISLKNAAAMGVGISLAQSAGRQILGSIGDITGDQDLEKNLNMAAQVVGVGILAYSNPYTAAAAVGTMALTHVVKEVAATQRIKREANYYRRIAGNVTDGSR